MARATKVSGTRRPKKAAGFSIGDDTNEAANARLTEATRIANAWRNKSRGQAKAHTEAQQNKLGYEIGTWHLPSLIRYVEYANGLSSTQGTLREIPWFEKTHGKVWLSRIYWIEAIRLATEGFNSHYTDAELAAEVSGISEFQILQADFDLLELIASPMPT